MRRERSYGPRPSVAEPRRALLLAVRAFVQEASACAGVRRIALVGSLATAEPVPKDADVLVVIDATQDLSELARIGRRLMGAAQTINLGADIFLADEGGHYLGRICHYRECHTRVLCRARNCARRDHLNDDLDIVTLPAGLIAAPPVDLWPDLVRRQPLAPDVETLLLADLQMPDRQPSIAS